jgi:hypothetical protein
MLANVFSYSLIKAGPQCVPESLYDRGAECFLIGREFCDFFEGFSKPFRGVLEVINFLFPMVSRARTHAALGLFDGSLTDDAAVQIEAVEAPPNTVRFTRIGDRRRQL